MMSGGAFTSRKSRANTWSDSELEELYDIKSMSPGTATKTKHLLQVLKAIRHCNKSKNIDMAINVVVESACEILECDRAMLYFVDETHEELYIRKTDAGNRIVLPLDDKSIPGMVYTSMEKLNIGEVSGHPVFGETSKDKDGYESVSVLCTPIYDAKYEPVAVLQAVNKMKPSESVELSETSGTSLGARLFKRRAAADKASKDGESSRFIPFTREDEVLMDHLSLQLGIILRNQLLKEVSERAHKQVVSLVDIVRSLHSNMGINSLMFTITERTPSLVDAEVCTLFVVDRKHKELWSLQGVMEIRVPMSKGLVGYTATTGETLNILDAHQDDRFNTEYDIKTGFRTKSVLVMPIRNKPTDGSEAEVIGVLQVINKLHQHRFSEEDQDILSSFLDIVGGLLTTSQLFSSSQSKTSEFGAALDLSSDNLVSPTNKRNNSASKLFFPDAIEEGDESSNDES
uniref:GAF domain-containing protein n=1 Tax=Mucochytrium quahogii TaxID=96639 RepID=A0A7S2S2T4_9STRA|mmetsp:Transcript_8226/g.13306  ORF Transcript_8226/g.13306 Transcript_8226/m.13306 type:complete len:458 (-) Transcript_8226:27-1400(-)|eukprot:CAMPEP_0203758940 /NCGR_PEP_ID=MMETSP0098-20131031/11843_1 /ASSEMBLY_ACC=CAM_ASM_000208 /TAXON_ID=96639 /ORGANISM=" , Strain NY0313808BC1" /LENGTH=457 /DNA_ID=CAMNT_0050651627 /DNA_START=523 /DNA_END=1896 /DNA_ORIENTATION=-